ncbi:MAG: proton-conducting transporter membrane subunit, partial [Corynebacterium sp.]|nr:proton-conducting transporter membrane subunit [Corynebacterium sp.]
MLLNILMLLGLTVALSPLVSKFTGRNAGWVLACPLLAAAMMAASTFTFGAIHEESVAWMPTIGVNLAFRFDGLSFVFLMLVLVIGAGVLAYATRYLHHKDTAFYFYICGFATAMALLVTTNNLMVFYVAWELTTLCSYFLIANSGQKGHQPAIRTLLVTVFGGLLLLSATIIMAITTGTMVISDVIADPIWHERPGLTALVAGLLALAAMTKSAQFPFQAWLPDSMVAIAPVSAYLHAAAMVKAGIYLILRYSPMMEGIQLWNVMLVVSGGFTALFGAMTAVRCDDLKELLAYSTMSQLGLLVLAVGIGTDGAITAAIVHTVAHACFKAALFMTVGIVEHEAGTRSYRELRHTRLMKMPVTKATVVIAGASMAGIPLLFGFVSKEGLITASVESGLPQPFVILITAVIVFTSVFTFAYSFRYIIGCCGATKNSLAEASAEAEAERRSASAVQEISEAHFTFWAIPALLAGVTVVLGIAPGLLDEVVAQSASAATGLTQFVHLALWHGINIPVLLTVFIIASGCVLVKFNRELARAMTNFGVPIRGLDAVESLRQGVIDFGARYVTGPTGTTSMRRHLVAPMLMLVLITVVGVFTLQDLPAPFRETSRPIDWIFTFIVSIGVLAAVMAKSRLTVVIVVAIAGFGTTLWFYGLGAADVATTQLTVEILTVCVLVLVLHRLPDHFTPETR